MAVSLAVAVLVIFLVVTSGVQAEEGLNVTWDPRNITEMVELKVYLGANLQFICPEGVLSRVEQQTFTQVNSCNKSADPDSTVAREFVGVCSGVEESFFVVFRNPSDMLPGVSAFPPGSYYFTSYTPSSAELADVYSEFFVTGGLCAMGLQLKVTVLENPTEPSTVDNTEATTSGEPGTSPTGDTNVDGPSGTTIDGPGGDDTSASTPNVGIIDGLHSNAIGLNGVTALSVTVLTLVTLLLH